ncbi:MAG: hypothetical protein H6Q98_882 [Nitrospirae bacterium]|nr:hypothetical protein [Nitrospirota bacterium]
MDKEPNDPTNDDLERAIISKRVLRLEERLDRLEGGSAGSGPAPHPAWPFALGCIAAVFGYLGMGAPMHPYQYLFSGLLLLLAYHRGSLRLPKGVWRRPQVAVNFLTLSQFFMIVLGGGVRHPLAWFKAPAVVKDAPPDGGSWYRALVPDYNVQWHGIPGLSDWSVDITKVQAFLLIATLAGSLFRFSGFASITALALLIISIPVYLSFTWDWVVLFLICGSISLYLQARASGPHGAGRW